MSNQPTIFNITYTPYKLKITATEKEKQEHIEKRSFYDMTGGKNFLGYIRREGKKSSNNFLNYLQKSTGVFNHKGMIEEAELKEMRARAQANTGNLWHGFISFNKEESKKIDTPTKCIDLVKYVFPSFIKEAHISFKNVDLMCALHLDKPEHLHIHFAFWEKEPKIKGPDGKLHYRAKGKIPKQAIDNMFVRLGLFVDEASKKLYKARDEAIGEQRETAGYKKLVKTSEDFRQEIINLAKDLPTGGRLGYASKEMEPFRERVDELVEMMLRLDGKARKADEKFYTALDERKQVILNICGKEYGYGKGEKESLPTYHYKIDEKNICLIEDIEQDYKRRQGNLIINLAKTIKPEHYERSKRKNYKTDDKTLKRSLTISKRNVKRHIDKFFKSFGEKIELFERDYCGRLQEIEEEMKREKTREKEKVREEEVIEEKTNEQNAKE